jgi:8-oxo-dGTP pyrophosphatase MutT (NUDIX family)
MVVLQESPTHPLSERSTAAVPDSIFHATDLILGTGVVIIQPSTSKIVLVTDKRERWFLPKGRKDKGESLEQTALREAYEEVNEPHSHPLPTPLLLYIYPSPISCFDVEG